MRRRTVKSLLSPSSEQASCTKDAESQKQFDTFQAIQTETSAVIMLNVVRVLIAYWLLMVASHLIFSGLDVQTILRALPRILLRVLLFGNKTYLQKQMKRYPITVALAVQCVGQITGVYGMVALSLDMPEGLLQHRAFLGQFLPMFVGTAATMYVPMPVFVMFVCPLYLIGWISFHAAVDFITMPCVLWALLFCGAGIYIQHFQTLSLWRDFQGTHTLQKERQLLQARHESFQGIVSSIFDASCVCNRNGQIKEFSSQLQELLALPDMAEGAKQVSETEEQDSNLNLCSFAATDVEAARLASFLTCTLSCARNQASKIRCRFRRGGSSSQQFVDLCMYASILQDSTPCRGGVDTLLIFFEAQSAILKRQGMSGDDVSQSLQSAMSTTLDDSLSQVDVGEQSGSLLDATSSSLLTWQRLEQEEIQQYNDSCSIFSLSDSLPTIPSHERHHCTTCGSTTQVSILPEGVSARVTVAVTAQTESDLLNLQDASSQTVLICDSPPKLPKLPELRPADIKHSRADLKDAQGSLSSQSSPARSLHSSAGVALRRESPTDESAGNFTSTSYDESGETDVEILIGGSDCRSSWSRSSQGQWERRAVSSAGSTEVSLSDYRALPKNSKGQLTSFGSLQHLIENNGCKPCPLFQKNGACRSGALCHYCHADHASRRQPFRKSNRRPFSAKCGQQGTVVETSQLGKQPQNEGLMPGE